MPGADQPFTRSGYRALLAAAQGAGYAFVAYGDEARAAGGRALLLRHDVDIDPDAAVELAELEAAVGARATYFVMLRSPAYNAFARSSQRSVERILALGHHIGLHFDAAHEPDDRRAPGERLAFEAETLAALYQTPVAAVSFHQPTHAACPPGEIPLGGLESAWNVPGYAYVSDANKAAGSDLSLRLLREARHERLQLVIHPEWWATDDPAETTEALWNAALLRTFGRAQEQFLATERGYGPSRTFTVSPTQ